MSQPYNRAHIFNPGPGVVPLPVLEKAREDILNFEGSGVGVMEISHRSPRFELLLNEMKENLAELMAIPKSHEIIFCTGGATNQFSMVPMNFLQGESADFIITDVWSEKALKEAKKFGVSRVVGSSKEDNYSRIPKIKDLDPNARYLHYTSNNTIVGTQFRTEPDSSTVPLCCDASSDILSRPFDVAQHHAIYAGAQKNIGVAGVTLVILNREACQNASDKLPHLMNYQTYIKNNSLDNTVPTFAIYLMSEVVKWVKFQGGVKAMTVAAEKRAALIYEVIDKSSLYRPCSEIPSRSHMNITFRLPNEADDARFVKAAAEHKLVGLKGHKIFGGIRASMYNSLPFESAVALRDFMIDFEKSF